MRSPFVAGSRRKALDADGEDGPPNQGQGARRAA